MTLFHISVPQRLTRVINLQKRYNFPSVQRHDSILADKPFATLSRKSNGHIRVVPLPLTRGTFQRGKTEVNEFRNPQSSMETIYLVQQECTLPYIT